MAMIIKYIKIMDNGDRKIKITDFQGIKTWDELPREYRTDGVRVYIEESGADIALRMTAANRYYSGRHLTGKTFTPEEFGEFICELKSAGHRLAEINKLIKAAACGWEGVTGEVII